ncbi:MAG: FAD-dependent oxidoreductase, partial [Blautia sp.]|nr:FAD-dependent oxidoreductase [Blautia sp.]
MKKPLPIVLAGILALTSVPASAAEASMTPGTYQVTATGCFAPFTIEVEVTEDAIAAVRIVETHESQYLGQRAQDTIAENVVAKQSVNVDSITGATITTGSMKKAIREALTQAGASEDMFAEDATTPPAQGVKGDISEFQPDVIVVGAGIAGLSAALTSADQGAKVLILEQNKYFGGSTMYSGGYIAAAGGTTMEEMGYETDPDRLYEWFLNGDESTFRPELSYVAAYNSGKALDILTKYGAKWLPGGPIGEGVGAHASAASAGNSTDEVDYFAAYLISSESRGLSIFEGTADSIQDFVEKGQMAYLLNTKVTELIQNEEGNVIGVRTEGGEEYFANATILASGGYCANEEMLSQLYTRWARSGNSTSIGNMFEAATKVGAVLHDMDYCRTDGGTLPIFPRNGMPVMREIKHNTPGLIWLNTEGKRFWKEGSDAAHAYFTTDANTIYCVANKSLLDSVDILYYGNYATFVTDQGNEELEHLAEEGKVIFKGDTIEEAAEKAGLDPAVVAAELEKYNGYCEAGVDEDFGKADTSLISLAEGPYYIFETIPNVKNTYGGLVIDDCAR